ncbi:hypothetical protein [Nocardioides marmoraquaticus]
MLEALRRLRAEQDGVVSRRQLLDIGATDPDVDRWRRRRLLTTVHPGVYVDHTGPLAWTQRAWAAVLAVEPAALAGSSALRAETGPGRRDHEDDGPVHVAVDHTRRVTPPEGVVVQRVRGLDERVRWAGRPPRVRVEEAVLDVAQEAATDDAAIAVLADAVQARLTTAARLADALAARSRVRRRAFLRSVLGDVLAGACSVLEHAYLRDVERAHGLPRGRRQAPTTAGRPGFRDVVYDALGLVVELDGRLGHTRHADQDRDLERDLDAATVLLRTLRLGHGQVVGRPCETAATPGRIMRALGWDGVVRACTRCPAPVAA